LRHPKGYWTIRRLPERDLKPVPKRWPSFKWLRLRRLHLEALPVHHRQRPVLPELPEHHRLLQNQLHLQRLHPSLCQLQPDLESLLDQVHPRLQADGLLHPPERQLLPGLERRRHHHRHQAEDRLCHQARYQGQDLRLRKQVRHRLQDRPNSQVRVNQVSQVVSRNRDRQRREHPERLPHPVERQEHPVERRNLELLKAHRSKVDNLLHPTVNKVTPTRLRLVRRENFRHW